MEESSGAGCRTSALVSFLFPAWLSPAPALAVAAVAATVLFLMARPRMVDAEGGITRRIEVLGPQGTPVRATYGLARHNSLAMIDAGGEILGVYRKSHIPDGRGYQEKF